MKANNEGPTRAAQRNRPGPVDVAGRIAVPPRQRKDDGNAFVPDPGEGPARVGDDFAEFVAEEYMEAATSGEEKTEDDINGITIEEVGGPFTETTAEEEFDVLPDAQNPEDAEKEPFPSPMRAVSK